VLLAHYLLSVGLADKVVVVPVYHHAFAKLLAPYNLRVEMCERAFVSDPRISVSQVERDLPSPSYTLHTLKALKALDREAELRLVVGADVLAETEHWHRFDEVKRLAPLLVLGRAGVVRPDLPEPVLPEISSTLVRRLCAPGASAAERARRALLVPAAVLDMIERSGLYTSQEA
jgi:nicotinate-nucleotide adenylyltransferase